MVLNAPRNDTATDGWMHAASIDRSYKQKDPVRCCAISDDHRDVLASLGDAFTFRYQHFKPKKQPQKKDEGEEEKAGNKEI